MTFGMLLLLLILANLAVMIAGIAWGYGRGARAGTRSGARWGVTGATVLILVILGAYGWWAISFPFWGEDDQFIACAKEYGLHCLRAAIGYGPMSWRPLQRLSVLTDFVLWGESVPGKNLQNLFLLFASAFSVTFFAYHLFSDSRLAIWTGVLFSLFPAHISVVTRIDQRGNPLCLIFALLSIAFFLKYWETGRLVWLVVASSGGVLALLSKETGFLLPIWVGLIVLFRLREGLRLKETALAALAFGLPWAAVLVMRAYHYGFEVWLPRGTSTGRSFLPTLTAYVSELAFPFLHNLIPAKLALSLAVVAWIAWEIWRNGLLRDWRYAWLAVVTVLTMVQFAYVAPVDIRLGFLLNRLYIIMGFFAILLTALLIPPRSAEGRAAWGTYRSIGILTLLTAYVIQLMVNRTLLVAFK